MPGYAPIDPVEPVVDFVTKFRADDYNHIRDHLKWGTFGTCNVLNTAYGDGADPTGSFDCSAAFQAADADNNGAAITVFPPGTYRVSANVTFHFPCHVLDSVRFVPDSGVTVTFSARVKLPASGCFSATQLNNGSAGSGTVVLGTGSVKKVYPQWWGYIPGATSDPNGVNQTALNIANLNSVSSGAPVYFTGQGVVTNVHGTITGRSGMRMKGHGGFIKIDTGLSAPTSLLDLSNLTDVKIEDQGFDGACVTFTESDRSNNTINCPNLTNATFVRVMAQNGRYSNISGYGTNITWDHCQGQSAGTHNMWCSTGSAGTSRWKVAGGTYLNAGRSGLGHNIVVQATSANVDTGDDVFIGGGVSCDFPTASATAGSNIYCAGNSNGTNTSNFLKGLRIQGVRCRRAGNGNPTFSGASIQVTHMCPGAVIDGFQDSESQFDGLAVGSANDSPDVSIANGAVWGCQTANGQGGNGVEVDASRCNLTNVTSYQNAGHGFYLAGRNNTSGLYTAGTGYHKGSNLKAWGNGYNGFCFPTSPNSEFHNCDAWLNGLSGYAFQSNPNGYPVQGVKIRGGRSYANTKYGLDTGAVYQVAIQGATNASPIVVQANNHGMPTGIQVVIANVGGNTAANGTWTIAVVDSSHFSLTGSTGNGAYTSGGTATNNSRCEGIDVDGLDFLAVDNGTAQPNTLGAWNRNTLNATLPDILRNCPGYNSPPTRVDSALVLSSSTTISNPTVVEGGGSYAPANGTTLSITGTFDAPLSPVFFGLGLVIFSPGRKVHAEWFGLSPVASAATNSAAILAALKACNGGTVLIGMGTFPVSSSLIVPSYTQLEGWGETMTVLSASGQNLNSPIISLPPGTVGNGARGLKVIGQGAVANLGNQSGIMAQGIDQTLENVWVDSAVFTGIDFMGAVRPTLKHGHVTNTLWTGSAGGVGMWVFRGNLDVRIVDLVVDGADCHALIFDSGTVSLGASPNIGAVLSALHLKNYSRNLSTPGNGLYIKGGRRIVGRSILIENGGYPNNSTVVAGGVIVAEDANGQISQDVDIEAEVDSVNYQAASIWSSNNNRIRVKSRNVGMAQPGLGAGGVFAATVGYSNEDRTPHNATATAAISGGAVVPTLTSGGDSYPVTPTIVLSGGDGSGAAFTPAMALTNTTIVNAGNYTTPPTLTCSGGGATTQATMHCTLNAYGGIGSVVIDTPGAGYTSAPTIVASGGGGLGGGLVIGLLSVSSISGSGGTGYTVAPTITFAILPADCTDNIVEIFHSQDAGVGEFDYGAQFATTAVGGVSNNCKRNVVHFSSSPDPGTSLLQVVGSNVPTLGVDANQVLQAGKRVATVGNPPSVVTGASAGTGATCSVDTGSTDEAGHLNLATGTGTSAGGTLLTVTFSKPYTNPPFVTITPSTTASASVQAAVYGPSVTTTGFSVVCAGTPAASYANYGWFYQVTAKGG